MQTLQSSGNEAWFVKVRPGPSGVFYLHQWLLRWDGAPSAGAGMSFLGYICSQPQTSNHASSQLYLSAHLNLRKVHTYSPFLSVAWFRVPLRWPSRAAVRLFPSQDNAQKFQTSEKKTDAQFAPLLITPSYTSNTSAHAHGNTRCWIYPLNGSMGQHSRHTHT